MYNNQQPQIDPKLAAAIALLQAPDAPAPNTVVGRMANGVVQQESQRRMADMQAAKMQMGVAAPLLAQQAEMAKMQQMAQMAAQMQGGGQEQGFAGGGPTLGSGPIVEMNKRADEYGLPNVSIYDSPEKRAAKIQRIQAAIESGPPEKARRNSGSAGSPNDVMERVGTRSEFPISETYEPGYENLPVPQPAPQAPVNKGIAQVLHARQQPPAAQQPAPQAPTIPEPTIQDSMNSAQRMIPDVDRSGINSLIARRDTLSQQRQGLTDEQIAAQQRIQEQIQRNRGMEDKERAGRGLSTFLAGLGAGGMGGAGRAMMGFNDQEAAQRKARIGEDSAQAERVMLIRAKALAEQMGDVDKVIAINEKLAELETQNAGHRGNVASSMFGHAGKTYGDKLQARTTETEGAANRASQEKQNTDRIAAQLKMAEMRGGDGDGGADLTKQVKLRLTMFNNDSEVMAKKKAIKDREKAVAFMKPGDVLYDQQMTDIKFLRDRAVKEGLDLSNPEVAKATGMPVQAAPQGAAPQQQNRAGWGKATIVQ